MKRVIFLIILVAMLVPFTAAMADETNPYLSGTWFDDSEHFSIFAVANPTTLLLNIDAAIFAEDGTFCGCNKFTLNPNGSKDFTLDDFTFVNTRSIVTEDGTLACGTNKGQVKVIAWKSCTSTVAANKPCTGLFLSDATLSGWDGYVVYGHPNSSSTFSMKSVTLNNSTRADMYNIYLKCFNLPTVQD